MSTTIAVQPALAASKRDAATTVSLVFLCQSFHSLTFGGIALFLPLIRADLHISFAQAGMLSVASTFTYALGQIPAGFLTDRYGPRHLFFIGIFGATACALVFGLVEGFVLAAATQVISGLFRALLFAPGLSLVSSWFPPERRATAMGVYIAGGFAGNILLSLAGPLMVASHGWRFPFIVFAVLGMGVALLFLLFAKEKSRRGVPPPPGLRDTLQLSRYPIIWLSCAIQIARMGPVVGINFWLPSFLIADRGMSIQVAGLITAMGAALSAPANLFGGYVSDRLRNPPLVIGTSLLILACTSILLVNVQSTVLLLLIVAINAIFSQFYFGPLFLVPVEVLGQRSAGVVTGFCNLFANAGSVAFAYALGVVKDRTGTFTWGFGAIAICCAAGALMSIALARLRQRELAKQAAAPPPAA